MKKPLTPQEFESIYSKVPRLCVDLIIKAPNGIVLTLRSLKTWNNQWHFPGGTVAYKETINDAVERIAQEEIGISVKTRELLGYIEYPSEEKERGFGWAISMAILCDALSENFSINNEASQVGIFNVLPKNIIFEQKTFLIAHLDEILK